MWLIGELSEKLSRLIVRWTLKNEKNCWEKENLKCSPEKNNLIYLIDKFLLSFFNSPRSGRPTYRVSFAFSITLSLSPSPRRELLHILLRKTLSFIAIKKIRIDLFGITNKRERIFSRIFLQELKKKLNSEKINLRTKKKSPFNFSLTILYWTVTHLKKTIKHLTKHYIGKEKKTFWEFICRQNDDEHLQFMRKYLNSLNKNLSGEHEKVLK